MVKAFTLFGCVVAICLLQGCGGKKAEIASAPSTEASSPNMPSMQSGSSETAGMGGGSNSSNGELASMSGMAGTGNEGGASGSGGYGAGYNAAGMPGSEGMASLGSAGFGNEPPPGYDSSGMPGGQNANRPRPKPLPPPTLKEQAVKAFQAGNAKRAYTLLQAHALHLQDDEAAEILKDYRWANHRKRPQLGVNIAVGLTIKNPLNATDLSPIGTEQKNQGGGGGDLGFGSMGGAGGMIGADGTAEPSQPKKLTDSTGVLSTRLAQAFKERHEKGIWAPAFQEYWLVTARDNGFGAMAGGGFEAGSGGFGNSEGGYGIAEGGFGNGDSGFGIGGEGSSNGGSSNGGSSNSGASNSGAGMRSSFGEGSAPGMGSPPGMGSLQGEGSQQPGKGPVGMSSGGGSPSGGGAVPTGSSGSRFYFLQGGRPGMFGDGRGPGGGMPPAFGNNAMLPAGSTPIAPCLTFIGVDEPTKLMKKAVQDGYDALMIFEVTIGINRVIQKVTNDTLIRVVQPNIVPKDVKKVYVSKVLNNLQVARSKSKGEPDGVDEAMEKIIKSTEEAIGLQAIPTGLTPEIIATRRIPALIKETETSVIDRLSEVNLYYSKGYLDETQKADAFEKIAGQAGRVIATGSPAEKLAEVGKLLEREFK